MKYTYVYDTGRNILRICGSPTRGNPNTAVRDFCDEHNVKLEEFNLPVEIDSSVVDCTELFKDCLCFDQEVVIPDGVKYCFKMFYHCESFNQPIILPESIKEVYGMFYGCRAFNQEVKIPDCVSNSSGMFMGCESLNKKVVLSNNTVVCEAMFKFCRSFNQEVILPEKVEDCVNMFADCIKFNQPVVVKENVTNCWMMFYGCESLNQPIQLLGTGQCCYEDIFVGCSTLFPENVTIYNRKNSRKNLEKKLGKMWGMENITEEIMKKINIITAKTPKKVTIKNISCTFGHKVYNITEAELGEMTLQEIHGRIEKMYKKGNLSGLEISAKSDDFMNTLCVYFDNMPYLSVQADTQTDNVESLFHDTAFCIGIIDDWKETALFYDSGEGEESVVIRGNYYPKHMVSNNRELLFMVVDEFLQSGKPTKKVKWTKG